jgi:hypothetical protein
MAVSRFAMLAIVSAARAGFERGLLRRRCICTIRSMAANWPRSYVHTLQAKESLARGVSMQFGRFHGIALLMLGFSYWLCRP